MKQNFPEDAEQIHQHQQQNLLKDAKDAHNTLHLVNSTAHHVVSPSACSGAVLDFVVDVISFLFSLVGIRASFESKISEEVQKEAGPKLNGFQTQIRDITSASSPLTRAKALWSLLSGMYKETNVFKAAFKALKEDMKWYDWIKVSICAVAQLLIWFATDGGAFIAEAVLLLVSAVHLISDGVRVKKICG